MTNLRREALRLAAATVARPVRRACGRLRRRGAAWPIGGLLAGLALVLAAGVALAEAPPHVPVPGGLRGRSCYTCHIEGVTPMSSLQVRSRRYSLAGAFKTYMESPHGRLRQLGDMRAPMCEDCHYTRDWYQILPASDPDSPINPRNLGHTCARCHGKAMLTAKVAEGSMHLQLRHRSLVPGAPLEVRYGFLPGLTKREFAYYIGPFDVTAYVSALFLVLTVGTLGAFGLYLVADLIRKLKERRAAHGAAAHHED